MSWLDRFKKRSVPETVAVRYRLGEVVFHPLGEDTLLWRRSGPAQLVPTFVAEALRRYIEFRSIPEHVHHLDAPGELAEWLARLAQDGWLVTEDLLGQLPPHPQASPVRLERVVVMAAQRPLLVQRLVDQLLLMADTFDRRFELVLADDSRLPEDQQRHQALLRAHPRVQMRYLGRPQRQAFTARLDLDPQVLQFALEGALGLPYTLGTSHNATLLESVDQPFLSLDDDVTGRVASVSEAEQVRASSAPDPTLLSLFPTREAAVGAVTLQTVDLLGLHEGYLGRSVHSLSLEPPPGGLLPRLLRFPSQVAVSSLGLVGDSGMGTSAYFLGLEGSARESLISNYSALKSTRAVLRAVRQPTLSDAPWLMTPCVGFDFRTLLPPFVPVQRNSDGVFALTLRTVRLDGLLAHLPQVIEHQPEPRQQTLHLGAWKGLYSYDLLMLAIRSVAFGAGTVTPEQRILALGRGLEDLAALPAAELDAVLRARRTQEVVGQLGFWERLLRQYDGPPEWTQDVQTLRQSLLESLEQQSSLVPRDLPGQPALVALLGGYGRLLTQWTALLDATRSLRRQGLRLSTSR